MFNKVLIANRGAIATRILRTLKKLEVESVVVYAECDKDSLHVRNADEAYSLGDGGATDTYLNKQKLLDIAKKSGAEAIHPGYGFLSENAEFVRECEKAGISFIGPTTEHMMAFGLKHKARELAEASSTPLLTGSGLLFDKQQASEHAKNIGYPVMLKSTAGGGGIGMQLCHDETQLLDAFDSVKRLGKNNFSNDGVFLEKFIQRARHIEVQMFGDGKGTAIAIGERDCSAQRRNQKVIEECPAPGLTDQVRQQLYDTSERLLASVNYRNAGTVEYIFDADTDAFYFLEVNTRLQVEHGVTEEVYGIDLVEWMLKQAFSDHNDSDLQSSKSETSTIALNLKQIKSTIKANGHAIQARIYAEDPYRNFQPSPGLLNEVYFPQDKGLRIDYWVESGTQIPTYFDPMLAKLIVHAESREKALQSLQNHLSQTRLYGTQTNLDYLHALSGDSTLHEGKVTTRYLDEFEYNPQRIDVLSGGTQTTIQDYPARTGYWDVGVPPSGPFDNYSFRLANRLLENSADSAALEITLQGPSLVFSYATQIVLTGAVIDAQLDDKNIPMYQVTNVNAGQQLKLGQIKDCGARAYLAIRGGIQCPSYLGSRSTFTLGQFGGHNGRALQAGDVLSVSDTFAEVVQTTKAECIQSSFCNEWTLNVIYGPHGAPDFFTDEDITTFFETDWEIHYNSSRTGVRLIGPKPTWARADGGEAGMHPSNIHDNAYAFGAVDFTGDMPVILGPDGPSLGGFVCPATVIHADLWKLGQLRAGDKVRFRSVTLESAVEAEKQQQKSIESLKSLADGCESVEPVNAIKDNLSSDKYGDEVTYRLAGDHFLLVEYGEQVLDIRLRFRVHALMQWLQKNRLVGMQELTPGIRSLQLHYDSQELSATTLIEHLKSAEEELSKTLNELTVPSRIVNIPLSWDDEACKLAIDRYTQSVRKDAPWCPSNLEFIRRINGLASIEEVKKIVFSASYLVMGLGDVYLGAPVATPLDPRHRLVTTKYNPARTWTAENSVGIGGSYMCVYGMEGPGGYQFVGRTLQMWNRYKETQEFSKPWLLRFFDQIRFYEVSSDELKDIRKNFPQGRYPLKIEKSEFSLAEYSDFLVEEAETINRFTHTREAAFEKELALWHSSGQFNFESVQNKNSNDETNQIDWPASSTVVESQVMASVWKLLVKAGDNVVEGDTLMILESMKMEINIQAPASGKVSHVLTQAGEEVKAGQTLVVLEENDV
ncbi:urea carboxylase [uncultured Cocleimonas sp.]|uniref:urea carboxylase n=1 Tax=uncultured Cocleimonas sp. TaxID=1051587 RepID=UPI002637DEE8|nr:urea carboxylase [uncultured Cocleimonas sp.]